MIALYDDLSQERTLVRHLKDVGCASDAIGRFTARAKGNERLKFLAEHRERLLRKIHADQKKPDTLDFLIFAMKRKVR